MPPKITPSKGKAETPSDDSEDAEPVRVSLRLNDACARRVDEDLDWANSKIPT